MVFFLKNEVTKFDLVEQIKSKIFFIRIFIIFLSIGILTTWSRIANLSYIFILLSFLFYSRISFKKLINPLSIVIIFILIFDVFVMAILFGNARLIERVAETSIIGEAARWDLHAFGWDQFKNFWLFGYGNGAFGQVFKIFYILPEKFENNFLADRVHNDSIELLGEVGILGISIISLLFINYFKKLINNIDQKNQLARFMLLTLLLLILLFQSWFDFSLHSPGISVLLMTILSIGLIKFKNKVS